MFAAKFTTQIKQMALTYKILSIRKTLRLINIRQIIDYLTSILKKTVYKDNLIEMLPLFREQ